MDFFLAYQWRPKRIKVSLDVFFQLFLGSSWNGKEIIEAKITRIGFIDKFLTEVFFEISEEWITEWGN